MLLWEILTCISEVNVLTLLKPVCYSSSVVQSNIRLTFNGVRQSGLHRGSGVVNEFRILMVSKNSQVSL